MDQTKLESFPSENAQRRDHTTPTAAKRHDNIRTSEVQKLTKSYQDFSADIIKDLVRAFKKKTNGR